MGRIFFRRNEINTIIHAFNFLLDNKLGFYSRDKPLKYIAEIYDDDNIYSNYATIDGKYQLVLAGNEEKTTKVYIIANGTIIELHPTVRYFEDEYGDRTFFCFDPDYTDFDPSFDNEGDKYRKEIKIHLKKWKCKNVVSEYFKEKENPENEDQHIYIPFDTDIFGVNIYDIWDKYDRCIYSNLTAIPYISSDDEYLDMTIYTLLERLVDDSLTPEMFNMQVVEV